MTGKYLIIKAKGGLGNRILSAVTGLLYAELSNRTPVIDWRDGVYAEFGTNAYPLLFKSPQLPCPQEFDSATSVTPRRWSGRMNLDAANIIEAEQPRRHSSPTVYRDYCVDLSRIDQPEDVAVFMSYLPKMRRISKHLESQERYSGLSNSTIMNEVLNRFFAPNDRVCTALKQLLLPLPRPLIGVHVRYSDLKVSLKGVARHLEKRLIESPGAGVFLSTDNVFVETWIRERFDRVYVNNKYLPEDGSQIHTQQITEFNKLFEAENALIDMWGLANCDELIYSQRSTFSTTSAIIGGIEHASLHDIDQFNLVARLKRLIQSYL